MRLALIGCHSFDYCTEFARVASLSCDVLYLADSRSLANRSLASPTLSCVSLNWPRHRQVKNMFLLIKIFRILRAWSPDVVHFLGENNVWLNLLMPFLRGTTLVTTVHDVVPHPGDSQSDAVPRRFADWFIRQSDAVIVHGEVLREAARRSLPVRPDRVFVLPHLPLPFYRELADETASPRVPDGRFRVLFFGRLYEYKGVDYLLQAAPLVQAQVPSVQFVVAGSGDPALVERVRKLPADLFDVRARFVPDQEVAELFSTADIVALPYIEASQSGVLMVALTFGLPAVVTDVGEIGEAVAAAEVGLVVPPRDAPALAAAITALATDPALRERLAGRARALAAGSLAPAAFAQRIRAVYGEILEGMGRDRVTIDGTGAGAKA